MRETSFRTAVPSPFQLLLQKSRMTFIDEEGEPCRIRLFSGMSPEEVEQLTEQFPWTIPRDIRELLLYCRGFSCENIRGVRSEVVHFAGEHFDHALFPQAMKLAASPSGNLWVIDLDYYSNTWGPVYFVGLQPSVVFLHSHSMSHFLIEFFATMEAHTFKAREGDHERKMGVPFRPAAEVAAVKARYTADRELASFGAALEPEFTIYDLRNAEVGLGFEWDLWRHQARLKRAGSLPIFAVAPAERSRPKLDFSLAVPAFLEAIALFWEAVRHRFSRRPAFWAAWPRW